jgi:hypothetical protein
MPTGLKKLKNIRLRLVSITTLHAPRDDVASSKLISTRSTRPVVYMTTDLRCAFFLHQPLLLFPE